MIVVHDESPSAITPLYTLKSRSSAAFSIFAKTPLGPTPSPMVSPLPPHCEIFQITGRFAVMAPIARTVALRVHPEIKLKRLLVLGTLFESGRGQSDPESKESDQMNLPRAKSGMTTLSFSLFLPNCQPLRQVTRTINTPNNHARFSSLPLRSFWIQQPKHNNGGCIAPTHKMPSFPRPSKWA